MIVEGPQPQKQLAIFGEKMNAVFSHPAETLPPVRLTQSLLSLQTPFFLQNPRRKTIDRTNQQQTKCVLQPLCGQWVPKPDGCQGWPWVRRQTCRETGGLLTEVELLCSGFHVAAPKWVLLLYISCEDPWDTSGKCVQSTSLAVHPAPCLAQGAT